MPKISDLPELPEIRKQEISIPVSTGEGTYRLSPTDMVEMLWDKMYVHAQKVIVFCPWCEAANARTNPTCVQCGGPMGAK